MADKSFDLEAVHDEKIFPLMAQIIEACKEHGLPFLCSFQYKDGDDGADFCTSFGLHGRECPQLARAFDVIYRGLPEDRLMAFTVTTK